MADEVKLLIVDGTINSRDQALATAVRCAAAADAPWVIWMDDFDRKWFATPYRLFRGSSANFDSIRYVLPRSEILKLS